YGPTGRVPRVVGGAGTEHRLVTDHMRVPADLLRPPGVPEQVRVVSLLPDEDQVRGGHELRDEAAARGGAGKGIGGDAPPAGVIGAVVLPPEFLFAESLELLDQHAADAGRLLHPPQASGATRLARQPSQRD